MLVLSRKKQESIVVGEDVRITVVAIGYGQVRIGIEAPRTTPVHRGEVYEAILRARDDAAAAAAAEGGAS
jgi:carbon storage regulator